jgi:glycosyltransferase 2 family protein
VQQSRLRSIWGWLGARFLRIERARMERQFDLTVEGFAPLRNGSLRMRIVLWSLLIWWLMVATNYALFFALPLQPSWMVAIVMTIVLQVAVAVPSTPGKIGVFQYLATQTLTLFGVGREVALSYGVLLYLALFVPQLLIAGPFVWQELMNLRRTRHLSAPSVESAS